jgi:hypothetical protein
MVATTTTTTTMVATTTTTTTTTTESSSICRYNYYSNCDSPYNDISVSTNITNFISCMNLCCNTVTCTHAAWENVTNKCWIKRGTAITMINKNNYFCLQRL